MKRSASEELPNPNKKYVTKFSRAITSEIYQTILDICFTDEPDEVAIDQAIHILWELDPCSTVIEGKFKGAISLMLYCLLAPLSQAKNLNINNLREIYTHIINHPNLDVSATFVGEGPHTGKSVLWVAVDNKQTELACKLIDMGADVNSICTAESEYKGISVLWLAVDSGQYELTNKLIENGADINATCTGESDCKGMSILWLALDSGQWELVDQLIALGADINATCTGESGHKGMSILWLAIAHEQWELVDELIVMGPDIDAICTGDGPDKGISLLWLAIYCEQWELVEKLIIMGANINTVSIGKGPDEEKSALAMLKAYNENNEDNLQAINKDIFYIIVIIESLQLGYFQYPVDVILTDEDKATIDKLKDKINFYIKIFIPTTFYLEDVNYYRRNHLNDLPEEMRKLIAIEYMKQDLANYSLTSNCIEYFSNKIINYIFSKTLEERQQAQRDLEKEPHLYELVLFSNILSALRNNYKVLDTLTSENMVKDKKSINKIIFKDSFLPAFEKAKLQNKEIAFMDRVKRLELYETAKNYEHEMSTQNPEKNTLAENDFLAIFEKFFRVS